VRLRGAVVILAGVDGRCWTSGVRAWHRHFKRSPRTAGWSRVSRLTTQLTVNKKQTRLPGCRWSAAARIDPLRSDRPARRRARMRSSVSTPAASSGASSTSASSNTAHGDSDARAHDDRDDDDDDDDDDDNRPTMTLTLSNDATPLVLGVDVVRGADVRADGDVAPLRLAGACWCM
jgi:hypothetical protein